MIQFAELNWFQQYVQVETPHRHNKSLEIDYRSREIDKSMRTTQFNRNYAGWQVMSR